MIRFSAITTIRGKDAQQTYAQAMQKREALAGQPGAKAFRTEIPRTQEMLYVFLTGPDAKVFQQIREKSASLLGTFIAGLSGKGNPDFESAEVALTQTVDEEALQAFLRSYPDRDVSGVPYERIDCNRYRFKPGTVLGALRDGLVKSLSSYPFVPRGQFDFDQDLKNPIYPFPLSDFDD